MPPPSVLKRIWNAATFPGLLHVLLATMAVAQVWWASGAALPRLGPPVIRAAIGDDIEDTQRRSTVLFFRERWIGHHTDVHLHVLPPNRERFAYAGEGCATPLRDTEDVRLVFIEGRLRQIHVEYAPVSEGKAVEIIRQAGADLDAAGWQRVDANPDSDFERVRVCRGARVWMLARSYFDRMGIHTSMSKNPIDLVEITYDDGFERRFHHDPLHDEAYRQVNMQPARE